MKVKEVRNIKQQKKKTLVAAAYKMDKNVKIIAVDKINAVKEEHVFQ